MELLGGLTDRAVLRKHSAVAEAEQRVDARGVVGSEDGSGRALDHALVELQAHGLHHALLHDDHAGALRVLGLGGVGLETRLDEFLVQYSASYIVEVRQCRRDVTQRHGRRRADGVLDLLLDCPAAGENQCRQGKHSHTDLSSGHVRVSSFVPIGLDYYIMCVAHVSINTY